jgi:spore coat protein JB
MTEREILLKRVQVYNFALLDVALFLDTHPNDSAALELYKQYIERRDTAAQEFEEKYGSLTKAGAAGTRWTWVDGPWPWQSEEEMK